MLLVGRHSVTRSDMVVIKKAKTKKAKKIKGQFQSEQFCQEKGNRGENPKNNPRQKKAISNMKQRNKIPGLPSSVKYQTLDFLFIHYIREKNSQTKQQQQQKTYKASQQRKKAQALDSFFLTLAACVFASLSSDVTCSKAPQQRVKKKNKTKINIQIILIKG